MLDVIAGPDERDRRSLPAEAAPFAEIHLDTADVRGLHIAWALDLGGYARVDPEVRQAVERAAEQRPCWNVSGPSTTWPTPMRDVRRSTTSYGASFATTTCC